MSISNIGRFLYVENDSTAFKAFPGSGKEITIPAGSTTGKITSWLMSGYYQLEPIEPGGANLYIKDSAGIPVDEQIKPGFLSNISTGISDYFSNTGRDLQKKAGFIKEGFRDSVSELGNDFSFLDKKLTKYLILAGVILALVLTLRVIK